MNKMFIYVYVCMFLFQPEGSRFFVGGYILRIVVQAKNHAEDAIAVIIR